MPEKFRRKQRAALPEVTELEAVRHFTRLSQLNFSIDTHFYPLGSCTMKYNPKACNQYAMLPEFLGRHPLAPESVSQGFLACMFELQEMLKEVTGMQGVSLTPMAGAHGEFAGVAMIRAYHRARGDLERNEIIVPDAAHGTNPATATMCGCTVVEIPSLPNGDIDVEALKQALGPHTAGIMLTNPSTLGVFERRIEEVAKLVHEAGGLLYYDGANLNAILGKVRPGDMGFDVIHMNLHKTFSTPHGGGGPGAGAVGVSARLLPFLPIPIVGKRGRALSLARRARPAAVHRPPVGVHGQCRRAAARLHLHAHAGPRGHAARRRVRHAQRQLPAGAPAKAGFDPAYPKRRASHEFIITLKRQAKQLGVTAMDFAKRLLDYGFHAPTTYFPLLVPECLLIEPTETESKEALDGFVDAMVAIQREAEQDPRRSRAPRIPCRCAGSTTSAPRSSSI